MPEAFRAPAPKKDDDRRRENCSLMSNNEDLRPGSPGVPAPPPLATLSKSASLRPAPVPVPSKREDRRRARGASGVSSGYSLLLSGELNGGWRAPWGRMMSVGERAVSSVCF